jgi:hypothetical protein
MMGVLCGANWTIFDYQRGRNSNFCQAHLRDEKHSSTVAFSRPICGGTLEILGSGCWNGGAKWQRSVNGTNHTIVYVDRHSISDFRYRNWTFVNEGNYDVVVLASELHDINTPLGPDFYEAPLQTVFGRQLETHLRQIQSWHKGPILYIGAWATHPKHREASWWWAAALTPVTNLAYVARSVVASLGGDASKAVVRHLDLIRPTLPFREWTSDGVHLFHPKPMDQLARLVWHDIAILTAHHPAP